ncbi:MAG: thioredoxin family protein [Stenotrophobium sp.]
MLRRLLLLVLMFPLAALAQGDADGKSVENALKTAQSRHEPVLADFHAPWCYSCYFMATHVLNGPEWEQVERDTVVVDLDADSPEGARWMKQWNVKALPAYIVLDEHGEELGRILAEQTRVDFYRELGAITAHGVTLAALQARVEVGGMPAIIAAREVLKTYYARRDASGALAWYAGLPGGAGNMVESDPQAQFWLDRLRLLQASAVRNTTECMQVGESVLNGPLDCERPYDLDTVMDCAARLPQAQQSKFFAAQRPALDKLVNKGAFGTPRCADQRSIVLTAADLDHALGDKAAEQKVLDRAITDTQKKIGGNLRKDRNLSDNLRVYLERAGRTPELDALLVKLIATYPDDYVYSYRLGKSLLAHGKADVALPYLEQAAGKAYGENRLVVATYRVQALKQLKRDDDARRVVAQTLKANGPWFPQEAATLKALVTS